MKIETSINPRFWSEEFKKIAELLENKHVTAIHFQRDDSPEDTLTEYQIGSLAEIGLTIIKEGRSTWIIDADQASVYDSKKLLVENE